MTLAASQSLDFYKAEFGRLDRLRSAGEPEWLRGMRHQAFTRFQALGFPDTRQEEWRFTNVAPIADTRFSLPPPAAGTLVRRDQTAEFDIDLPGPRIVLVNGAFAPHLSDLDRLPAGVSIGGLGDALRAAPDRVHAHLGQLAAFADQPFVALNTAFVSDGACIEVAQNVVVDVPLQVLFVSAPAGDGRTIASHPRLLVVAQHNSQFRLVERYVEIPGPVRFTNAVTEVMLNAGAVVDHYRVQREAAATAHVSTTQIVLSHSGNYSSHAFTFGGGLVRNDINVLLSEEGGEATLNGLYIADGSRLVDNHTFIDHASAHCSSHEVYKGILAGRARAVFNGKIMVRPDAQKTDAKQTNKTLLLSDDAQINTKPQLEIYANDVKCTHGATIGQLSADALFYLRARGIGRVEAEKMLIEAFATDITGRVRVDALRRHLDRALVEGLTHKDRS